jgi:outer membrane lipoprotein-sorting protein
MQLVPDEAANPKGIYQIRLTPKSHLLNTPTEQIPAKRNIKEFLEIWVKEGEWLPVQFGFVTEYEDGSRRNVITKLSKIQRDKKLPLNAFKFAIPKGAEVIDLSEK